MNWTILIADLAIAIVLIALALFLIWRLADFFKRDGRWSDELADEGLDQPPTPPPPLTAPLQTAGRVPEEGT